MRSSTIKGAWLWFVVGVLALIIGLLIGPRVPDDQQAARCVVNVHLPGPFGISLNCDSPEFLRLANMPSGLLEPKNVRQSRPGLIIAAAVIARPIMPLVNIPSVLGVKAGRPDIDPSRIGQALTQQFPAYAAYMLLNLLVLCATFFCLIRIVAPRVGEERSRSLQILIASLGLLVVANDVTKAYFWTPHTQMFNIFIPVFGLYTICRAFEGAFDERSFAVVTGLVSGFGMTMYPTFLVVILCAAFAGVVSLLFRQAQVRPSLTNIAIYFVLGAAPLMLWYGFVQIEVGSMYSEELASVNGPSRWIPRVFAEDGVLGLVQFVYVHLLLCLQLAAPQTLPLLMALAIVAALAFKYPQTAASAVRGNAVLAGSALFLAAMIAGFYSASGDMHFRWAQALIPPLIAAAAAVIISVYRSLQPGAQRALTAAGAIAAVVQIAFTIAKNGPFS